MRPHKPNPRVWYSLEILILHRARDAQEVQVLSVRDGQIQEASAKWTFEGKPSLPPSFKARPTEESTLLPNCRATPEAFARLPPDSGSRPRVSSYWAEQLGRELLQRVNDSTLKETWGFRAPPPPSPAHGALARRPRPRRASSCPSGWSPVRAGLGPLGRVQKTGLRPLPGLPASTTAEKRPRAAGGRPTHSKCSQRKTAPELPAGPGGAARAAGWLCQSLSAGSAAHVS